MFAYARIFDLPEMAKNEILDFSGSTCVIWGYFIQYFICKCSFREISMRKNVILDQSKPISLYFKIKKFKIQKSKICKLLLFIIIIIIYHDFLPTPRRGSHVKSGKTHTQSSRYTP